MPSPAPARASVPAGPLPAPVFVDDTGRRHRFVRAFGWVLAGVVTVYLGLLAVSLVGSPGLVPLSLPGPAAASVSDGAHAGRAGDLVPTAAPKSARTPSNAATVVVSAGTAPVVRQQHSRARAGVAASAAPTAAAPRPATSASPTPTRTAQGKGTPQSSPHSSTHPTPHSTHAGGATAPTPSPTTTATP